MARSIRKQFPGAKYHVTNRGNGRSRIFYGQTDYERFVIQLEDALIKDKVVLYAYCLMPNHFHLFVETPQANLAQFMGRLSTAYAMYFRFKHYRPGHCFQGRYKAPLVAGDDYVRRLTRYIHLNPVKVTKTARWSADEKWSYLRNYRWSSLTSYLRTADRQDFVDCRWLGYFNERAPKKARASYARYMRAALGTEDSILLEAMQRSRYAIGDDDFVDEVESWVRERAAACPAVQDVQMPVPAAVPIALIVEEVAREFGIPSADLGRPRVRLGAARGAFVELACTMGKLSQREVARHLGSVTEHAVSKQRAQWREACRIDDVLAARVESLRRRLKSKL